MGLCNEPIFASLATVLVLLEGLLRKNHTTTSYGVPLLHRHTAGDLRPAECAAHHEYRFPGTKSGITVCSRMCSPPAIHRFQDSFHRVRRWKKGFRENSGRDDALVERFRLVNGLSTVSIGASSCVKRDLPPASRECCETSHGVSEAHVFYQIEASRVLFDILPDFSCIVKRSHKMHVTFSSRRK